MNGSPRPAGPGIVAKYLFAATIFAVLSGGYAGEMRAASERPRDHLARAKVFLAAGDYRRALDACLREVEEAPSAASYVYLTYVYQAIDGYLEYLAKEDKWVVIELLYLNLSGGDLQNLTDQPDVLARIAKEVIQGGARKQSDLYAAMAARLDVETTNRLWTQQTAWRTARPNGWWAGVPENWGW